MATTKTKKHPKKPTHHPKPSPTPKPPTPVSGNGKEIALIRWSNAKQQWDSIYDSLGKSITVYLAGQTPVTPPPGPVVPPQPPVTPPPGPVTTTGQILHGAMVDPTGNENCNSQLIKNFNNNAKKNVAFAYFTDHWFKTVPAFPQKECDECASVGAIPFLRLNADELKSTVVDCAAINSGKYDKELNAYAQSAKQWGGTIFAEIGTEVNGKFLAFSGEGKDEYKKMARKVITLFKGICPNVRWVFHGDYNDPSSDPASWYPGDDLFDYIGSSFYGQSNGKGCVGSLQQTHGGKTYYDIWAATGSKPLAILEWGIGDPTDIKNTLNDIPTKYPKIGMLSYWNEKGQIDRRIEKDANTLSAYQKGIANPAYVDKMPISHGDLMPPAPNPTTTPADGELSLVEIQGTTVTLKWNSLDRMGYSLSLWVAPGTQPPPQPPVTPPPGPVTGHIGPDGVLQILPTLQNGSEFFLTENPDKNRFNISYGGGSHIPYTKKTEGGLVFFNTEGWPVVYHSDHSKSKSMRLDMYADGGIWNDKTPYSWDNNPVDYLYTDKGIRNGEYTAYIRGHQRTGNHHAACAWKLCGRDADDKRSVFEICNADFEHIDCYGHYDYLHFPYVTASITILDKNHGRLKDEEWYGTKSLRIVDPSRKFVMFYLFEDTNPFGPDGKPLNNWKLIAMIKATGCKQYKMVVPTWRSQKDLLRVDGYSNLDFCGLSAREIDPSASPVIPLPHGRFLKDQIDVDEEEWEYNPLMTVEEFKTVKRI